MKGVKAASKRGHSKTLFFLCRARAGSSTRSVVKKATRAKRAKRHFALTGNRVCLANKLLPSLRWRWHRVPEGSITCASQALAAGLHKLSLFSKREYGFSREGVHSSFLPFWVFGHSGHSGH